MLPLELWHQLPFVLLLWLVFDHIKTCMDHVCGVSYCHVILVVNL